MTAVVHKSTSVAVEHAEVVGVVDNPMEDVACLLLYEDNVLVVVVVQDDRGMGMHTAHLEQATNLGA